jgi:uroporphyrinogen-III synthase
MPFDGLRVLSLESRRAKEIERLIRNQGGEPFVAPSMRERPLEDNPRAFEFAERLFHGDFDMVILLTGVGTRLLVQALATRWPANAFADALRGLSVVVRGPKPLAVMREWGVPVTVIVPEPNTWREILTATESRTERRIAVQEYGRPSAELYEGLIARGAG